MSVHGRLLLVMPLFIIMAGCHSGRHEAIESRKKQLADEQKKEKEKRLIRKQGVENIRYLRSEQKALVQQLTILEEKQVLFLRLQEMRASLQRLVRSHSASRFDASGTSTIALENVA
jgi:hypothetical protein